jgi:hypothetical protein
MLCPPKNHGCLHQAEMRVQSCGGCVMPAAALSDTTETRFLYNHSRIETMIQLRFDWFHYVPIESVLN